MKTSCIVLILTSIILINTTTPGYSNWPLILKNEQRGYTNAQSQQSTKLKYNGEHGLWVQDLNGHIIVHWITAQPDSGYLIVINGDNKIEEHTTPVSFSHKVTFDKPQSQTITIRYGSLGNKTDKHETALYFEAKRPKAIFTKVDSIYVLGDIHGYYDNLVQLLKNANLIDSKLNWIANKRHLVALGDLFDRGNNVTKTLWFLYKLERQAEKAGGKVHILLGNHEIMTFVDDLRYLTNKERLIAKTHNTHYSKMYDIHDSILGKWLALKPGMIRIDNVLFAHGGVSPIFNDYSVQAFNDSLYRFINEDVFTELLLDSLVIGEADSVLIARRLYFFFGDNSVLWYRGYVQTETLENELKSVLKKFKSKLQVVAHTPVETIRQSYDGKLIAVDLNRPATEMLLLVRYKKKKYKRFKIQIDGSFVSLENNE